MKKILLVALVGMVGLSFQSKAQDFVTSFGLNINLGIPQHVVDVVYHDYYDFDWVHANRVIDHGHAYFDVMLQRGGTFVELRIGGHGRIYQTRYYDNYPLAHHVCSNFCGFHDYYYATYNNGCHGHNHHGHNHVIYRPRPVSYVYGGYRHYPKYIVYNRGPKGHAHGYYKKHGKSYKYKHDDDKGQHYNEDRKTQSAPNATNRYSRMHEQPARSRSRTQTVNYKSHGDSSNRSRSNGTAENGKSSRQNGRSSRSRG